MRLAVDKASKTCFENFQQLLDLQASAQMREGDEKTELYDLWYGKDRKE